MSSYVDAYLYTVYATVVSYNYPTCNIVNDYVRICNIFTDNVGVVVTSLLISILYSYNTVYSWIEGYTVDKGLGSALAVDFREVG